MSMTREEAIKFAHHAYDMTDIPDVKEFYAIAENALREQEQHRWIPVTERLPEIGDQCIVAVKYKYDHEKQYTYDTDVATYTFDGGYIDDCWDTYNDWDEGQQFLHVTHWMPMPEPPKEGT